jgi:hypothetical protein
MVDKITTDRLCAELREFLGIGLADVDCRYVPEEKVGLIDFQRFDTYRLMKELGAEEDIGYYMGSLLINEIEGTVHLSEIAVPLEDLDKIDKMLDDLRRFGCDDISIHEHPELGVAHIHIRRCPIRSREHLFARLVST